MTDEPLPSARPFRASNGACLLFLAAVSVFALFFNLGGRSVDNKDFMRHAEVAREVLEFNDWIMMHEGGELYVDKPPLHFWFIAASYKLFGVGAASARLPMVLFALGGVFLTYWFARRLLGSPPAALLAAIGLLASYEYFYWARRTRLDIEFAVLFAAAMVLVYLGCDEPGRRRKALFYLGFWAATAGGFLLKGPVALLTLAVALPCLIVRAARRDGSRPALPLFAATFAGFLVPVSAWALALWSHPDFELYWDRIDMAAIASRRGGLFYYLPGLLLRLMPMTPFALAGIWSSLRSSAKPDPARRRAFRFMLLWTLVFFALLHTIAVKSDRYLLPIFMPLSIFGGWAIPILLGRLDLERSGRIQRALEIAVAVAALGSMAFPFAAAQRAGAGLLAPVPYLAPLAAVLFLAARLTPVRPTRLFTGLLTVFLVIDVGDSMRDDEASHYRRIHRALVERGLSAETSSPVRVVFHRARLEDRSLVSFYFRRVVPGVEDWGAIAAEPSIRGVVMPQEVAAERLGAGAVPGLISLPEGLVLYMKPAAG